MPLISFCSRYAEKEYSFDLLPRTSGLDRTCCWSDDSFRTSHRESDGLDEERESLGKKLNVPEHYRMSVMKVMESEAPLKPGEIVGRYNGNTETAPTSTEFSLNSKNVLVGHYSSTWEGSTYEGMLDHPLIGSDHDIAFIWHDKFGSGPVHFVFNDADNAFWGDWKTITVAKNLPLPYR